MGSAWGVFRNEAAKMARLKLIYLGPLCVAAASVVFALSLRRLTPEAPANGWTLLTLAAQLNVTGIIPIFLLIYGASLVAGETDRGTIRFVLSRPVGRLAFLWGKTLAAWLYLGVLLASAAAAGLLAGAAFGRLGPAAGPADSAWTPWGAAWQIAVCFLLSAIPLGAVALFALTVSVYARTLLGAICFAVGFWITLTLTQGYFAGELYAGPLDLCDLLFTGGLDRPLRVAQSVASDSVGPWDEPGLAWGLAVSAAWIALFWAVSAAGFCRQDLNRT